MLVKNYIDKMSLSDMLLIYRFYPIENGKGHPFFDYKNYPEIHDYFLKKAKILEGFNMGDSPESWSKPKNWVEKFNKFNEDLKALSL